jgi:hypothetical protein
VKKDGGQVRVVEALLSTFIIFSALTICSTLSPISDNNQEKRLAAKGMQALIQLDSDDGLGKMIEQSNWAALSEALQLLLPTGVSYNLTVYDKDLQQVNNIPICNGFLGGDVAAVEYLCVSQSPQYHCYTLRLQLALVE